MTTNLSCQAGATAHENVAGSVGDRSERYFQDSSGLDHVLDGRQQKDGCLVSVIIPDYNQAHFIRDAIDSVLRQTYNDYEIIVVDDGSTDDSSVVVAEYGDQVHYIHQPNQGLSAARNTGIAASRGQLIALLDSDDAWLPDYLVTMVTALGANPQAGAAYAGWQYMDSLGRDLPQSSTRVVAPEEFRSTLAFGNFLVPSGVLVRRQCFDEHGLFDTQLRAVEDRDMWLRIAETYPVVGVPQVLVRYRTHGENMTKDLARMETARRAVIAKHFGPEAAQPAAWLPMPQRAYGGLYMRTALDHLQAGETQSARQYLLRAFVILPALLKQLDTYYELACTDQPRGVRGLPGSVNLARSAENVFGHLEAVFTSQDVPQDLVARKSLAYGYANLALGILAYNTEDMKRARAHLLKALSLYPTIAVQSPAAATLLKTLLGERTTHWLKHSLSLKKAKEP